MPTLQGGRKCYVIIRGGFQNCYITLYEGGGGLKIKIFALYNIWMAPTLRSTGTCSCDLDLCPFASECLMLIVLPVLHLLPSLKFSWHRSEVTTDKYLIISLHIIMQPCNLNLRSFDSIEFRNLVGATLSASLKMM